MSDRLCMKCMHTFDKRYDICPRCGTIVGMPPIKEHHIRPGTLLRGRYVLGYALRDKGNILYIGYDLKYSTPVLIEECYNSRYMDRASDGQRLVISRRAVRPLRPSFLPDARSPCAWSGSSWTMGSAII